MGLHMKILRGKVTQRNIIRWARILAVLSVFLFSSLSSYLQNVEAKPLSIPDAAVTVGIPSSVMIGDDFSFTVTFENNGTTPGYGPFIDLVFPLTGQDGNDGINYDVLLGSTYLGVALEDDVQIFPNDGSGTGCVNHPWLRDTSGNFVDVCGKAGDQFVSIRLPFGSYVPGQPRLDVTVNAHLSNLADLTPDLLIYARGGYMFGATPEDDWCCGDAPFAVPNDTDSTNWPDTPVSPQLMTFDKSYTGPGNTEDETATGPNFPRQYTLTVTIADGQTLTDIDIQDLLPDNVQFIGIDAGNTSAGYTVNSLPSTTDPGGTLSLRYASWTGTIVVTYDFYIPELFDLPNPPDDDTDYDDPVIDPATGNDVNSENIAWVDASWVPLDPRDDPTPITSDASCPTCTPLHTLVDKSIAIQKSVSVVAGTGGGPANDQAAPGAILEYTLQVQVSDFFTLDDIVVTDTISDGQHVLPSSTFVPTLEVIGNPGNYGSVGFNAANYEILCDYTGATTTGTECTAITTPPPAHSGRTTLTFNVSDEIGGNGRLVGGCVNPAGGMFSPCDYNPIGDSGAGPTTATIVFQTQILDKFVDDYPSGDISVDQGDELDNSVDVRGDVLDNTTFNSVDSETDNATAGAVIGRYSLAKTIYAINDDINSAAWDRDSLGRIRIKPGDKITYRLTYDLLTSDVEELTFDDYFPLPVFDVTDPDDVGGAGPAWSFTSAVAIPAPGVVALGPADTFYSYMSAGLAGTSGVLSPSTNNTVPTQDPVIIADGPANKINIYYADYDDTRNQSTTVDLLFSLVVSDAPFADGLFLTNMAHAFEGSTNAGTSSSDAIYQFVLAEPILVSTKGIIWKSNTNPLAVFDPVQTGPVGINFLDPSNTPRWTGTINSSGLAANPIDSNISGVDAGDLLTFAIVIENQGSSTNGAFDIQVRDILDTDYYQIPLTGLNLQVYYGDGSGPIPYESVDGTCLVNPGANNDACGEEIFEEGLELIDPVGEGVCSPYDLNSGNNVILITYDLELKDDVIPGQAVNTSTVFNFAGTEDGANHLEEVDDLEDDATADVVAGLEKTLERTEILTATNSDTEVVIGEIVTYKLSVTVPEGEVPNARLIDQLDGGLAFVSCDATVVPNPNVVGAISTDFGTGSTTDFSTVCAVTETSGVTNNGQTIEFDLGNLTNSDRDNTTDELIEITYQVVVLNVAGNQNTTPTTLDNAADFVMDAGSGDEVIAFNDADDVTVIEPLLEIDKTALPTSGDYGDTISYSIDIDYAAASETTAYDVVFTDSIPADMSYVGGSLVCTVSGSLSPPDICTEVGDVITVEWLGLSNPFENGSSATIEFDVTIDISVSPGEVITNTGEVSWTSLAGDETTPRSIHNLLSVERTGDDTGPGGAVNDYLVSDTADVTIFSPTADKIVTGTNQVFTVDDFINDIYPVAVGEMISYRSSFTIPEGTSSSAILVDTLDRGLAFVSCDNVYVTETVSGSLTTTTAFDCSSAVFSDYPNSSSSNQGRRMTLNLGVVTNWDTNNTTAESLTVEYTVVAINNSNIYRGNTRNNEAIWNWDGGSTSDSAQDVIVVEPGFDVSKIASPGSGDHGDTISYTIDLDPSAASNVNAYDVVLTDTIPADMTYVPATLVCTPSGGLAPPDICSITGDTLTVEWSGATKPFETTHSVQITYDVTIDISVSPGDTLTNDVVVTWTSLPGDVSTAQSTHNPLSAERTGDTTDIGGSQNDYRIQTDADVTIFSPTGSKTVDRTNQSFTSGFNVAVGEQVTYIAEFIIPEGTSVTAQLIDTLEAGLAFVSCDDVRFTETVPGSLSTTTAFHCSSATFSNYPNGDPENEGRRMTIDLGVVENSDTNNATDESITVEYTAVVINSSDVYRTQTLTNDATWTWASGSVSESAETLTVQEPDLDIDKAANPASGDAGDLITITIDLYHTGASDIDAYEVSLVDVIPAKTSYVPTSLVCTPAGGLALPSTCSESGGTITVAWSGISEPFETGHSAQIEFQVTLDGSVNPTEVINNNADLVWTSLPTDIDTAQSVHNTLSTERTGNTTDVGGSENDYFDADDADVTIPRPGITKYVETPAEFTIGETFIYDLVITLPDGTTPALVVEDDIPVGLEVLSYNLITAAGAGGSRLTADFDGTLPSPIVSMVGGSGGDITFDFGDTATGPEFPNDPDNNQFQIQIEVRMLNVLDNQHGDTLTNSAELRYSSGTAVTNTVDVLVIEPLLEIQKSVDDDTPALGQTITYELHITNMYGIPIGSAVDAHDVVIVDTLPAGVGNPNNVIANGIPGSCGSIASWSYNGASNELSIFLNVITLGCDLRIRYDADVDSTPALGSTLTNNVLMTWTSLSGPSLFERTGEDGGVGLNDYEVATSDNIVITNPDLRISKDDGVLVYIPGTSLTYTIIVENVGNENVLNAEVIDTRPTQISTWTWSCVGATNGATGCTPAASSANNFSDFINLPANSSITYQVDAVIPSSATGDLTNTAEVIMPAGFIEPTPADNIDSDTDVQESHADLSVVKDDGLTIIAPGETITYTVVAANISPSDVAGATVTDLIPAEIVSWTWSCTGSTGSASGCTGTGGFTTTDFSDLVDLPANSSITYSVTAVVSDTASGTLTNEVTIETPAGVTDDNLTNNIDEDVDRFATHEKNLISLLHGVTTLPDVAIGEILTYEVTLTVPPGSMTNTHLVDTLDRGLAFVSCESITPGIITTSAAGGYADVCANPVVSTIPSSSPNAEDGGRQVDFDFDTLTNPGAAPADLVIRYQVVVLNSLANQSNTTPLLVNEAEWVWDSGILTDQAAGVNILEPDMALSKNADPTILYPGQLTTFTLIVGHTPGSQTSAYDVEVVDILPADLIFQSASHVSGQAPTAILTAGDPTILIQWDEFLNNGVNSVIDIVVMLDPDYQQRKGIQYITNEASLSWTSIPGDFTSPQSTHNTLSTERFYDPLSNINIYGLGDTVRLRIPALPDTGFAPGKVTDLPEQKESQDYGDLDGLRVEINKLGISVPIVSVPKSENGWDLTWLWNQAGWLEGTAYPSWYGNTVITGHAYLPSGYPGPFVDLGKLSWGDEITLYSHGLKYTYQVRFADLVAANDYSILQHKDQDWLTLFTCKDFSEELGGYIWRQAVQAVLIDVENME